MVNIDGKSIGDLLVSVAQQPNQRRSYRHGISVGAGRIPYYTGRLQKQIYVSQANIEMAVIVFDTNYASYLQDCEYIGRTNKPNLHRGFLELFIKEAFKPALERYAGGRVVIN